MDAIAVAWLPGRDGGPAEPCPELLTEEQAIRYLRLDQSGRDASQTLEYWRNKKHLLRGTRVSKEIRYRRVELERFLEKLTSEQN
jgi:hypothetical protein